jgi:hypothetical protein
MVFTMQEDDTHEDEDTFTSVGALALKVMDSILRRQVQEMQRRTRCSGGILGTTQVETDGQQAQSPIHIERQLNLLPCG